jgi:hypothetical protein
MIGHDLEMGIGKMVFTGDGLPFSLFHAASVVAVRSAGNPA